MITFYSGRMCGPGWDRTSDPPIMSRLLSPLSYGPIAAVCRPAWSGDRLSAIKKSVSPAAPPLHWAVSRGDPLHYIRCGPWLRTNGGPTDMAVELAVDTDLDAIRYDSIINMQWLG